MSLTDHPLSRWETWREIVAQPAIWRDWATALDVPDLRSWVSQTGAEDVWCCGAGSSAYIGEIVASGLEGAAAHRLRAVPTTDLVSRPNAYLDGAEPLIVNFGRSGNSAETIGTLDALDALLPDAARLNITCNAEGALAKRASGRRQRAVVLPAETHDAGFAMTSSFTTMLLTALAIFQGADDGADRIARAADTAASLLPALADAVLGLPVPSRAVYVGTGPLGFVARESALKVLELSAGEIPALWDTTLGFRHGPKSFVANGTAIHIFLSSEPHAAEYDRDLVDEVRAQFPQDSVTTIGPGGDVDIAAPDGDVWLAPLAVLVPQMQAVVWSDELGLNVDDPFAGRGTLKRVVSGVRLYPVNA